jgi:hypothetical protein
MESMNMSNNVLPKTPFKGSFKDFLAFAVQHPASCESAHARFFRL